MTTKPRRMTGNVASLVGTATSVSRPAGQGRLVSYGVRSAIVNPPQRGRRQAGQAELKADRKAAARQEGLITFVKGAVRSIFGFGRRAAGCWSSARSPGGARAHAGRDREPRDNSGGGVLIR